MVTFVQSYGRKSDKKFNMGKDVTKHLAIPRRNGKFLAEVIKNQA